MLLCIWVLLIPAGDLHSAARVLCHAGRGLPTLKAPRALSTMMFGTCLAIMSTAIEITMCLRRLQTLLWNRHGRLQVCHLHRIVHISHALSYPFKDCQNPRQHACLSCWPTLQSYAEQIRWPASLAPFSPACLCVTCASLCIPSLVLSLKLPTGHPISGLSSQRLKLQLQPRSAPLPADASAQPQSAPAAGGQRPKLQLQPRSKPVEGGSVRQSSLFGAARPREEILKVGSLQVQNMGSIASSVLPHRAFWLTLL